MARDPHPSRPARPAARRVTRFAQLLGLEPLEPRDVPSAGSVANQAEQAMRTDLASRLFGTDGTGIVVGVISDSADRVNGGMAASRALGDLPPAPRSQVLLDGPPDGTDEGRAMMELIHDIAPGATLLFASGVGGDGALASAINLLVARGADIIVDDLNGLATEPFFQDGLAAQAVTAAVGSGVSYFSSAGNQGSSGYDTPFRGVMTTVSGIAGRWHNFNGGAGPADPTQTVTLQPGTTTIVFQYDDPFYGGTGVTHNADLYLFDARSGSLLAAGTDDNVRTTHVPREIVTYVNTSGAPIAARLAVLDVSGGDIGRFKYVATNGLVVGNHLSEPGAIVGGADPTHGGATAAIAVAASPADNPTVPEPTTGVGPVTRVFDPQGNRLPSVEVRNKPELTAVDRVSTTVAGHSPFVGTSAAAPNAAAVAALALAYRTSLNPSQLRSALDASTIDIAAPGYDFVTGYGLLDATAVLLNLGGGALPVTGDHDFANEDDKFVLRLGAADKSQLDVVVNGDLVGSVPMRLITSILVDGKGGNDTLTLDYSHGMFAVPGGIQFVGGSGTDAVAVSADTSFSLTDTGLVIGGGGTVTLDSVEQARLTGGPSADVFAVSDWTGAATLDGGAGGDTYNLTLSGGRGGTVTVTDTGTDAAADALTVGTSVPGGAFALSAGLIQLGAQQVLYGTSVESLSLAGSSGDDTFAIDVGLGMAPGTGLAVTGAGGNDTLVLTDVGDTLDGETYQLTGPASGTILFNPLNYFKPGDGVVRPIPTTLGPIGALTYTGVTTVTDTIPTPEMDVFALVPGTPLTVRDGGTLPGGLTAGLVSGSGTAIVFARKGLVTVNGMAGANAFLVDNPTAPTGMTGLDLYGNELTGGAINADDGAADGFDIRATSVPVRAFGQGGDDAFRVSSAAGTLDRIGGDLTIVGGTGTNTLSVSDVGAAGGNADVRLAGDAITGFAGPNDDRAITYSGIASLSVLGSDSSGAPETFTVQSPAAALALQAGGGDDTINVVSLALPAVIDAGGGNDIVNVSSAAPEAFGTLAGITAGLAVVGGPGNDILNVGDGGDASGVFGQLTPTQLSGLGLPAAGINYDGSTETLNVTLGDGPDAFAVLGTGPTTRFNLNTGGGDDAVFVRSVSAATSVSTGAGDDAIRVSSNAGADDDGNLDGIRAPLTIDAGGGTANTLVVSDSGGAADQAVVVTNNGITGLAPAAVFYAAAGGAFDPAGGVGILIRGSDTGADAFAVLSTLAGSTTRIETGGGDDAVAVGSAGPSGSLDGVAGPLTLDGGAGTNLLTVNDAGAVSPAAPAAITATQLTGFAGPAGADAPITYANFATLGVSTPNAGSTVTVLDPSAALTLNTGSGADDVTVLGLVLPAVIDMGGGHTSVTVGGSGHTLADLLAALTVSGGPGVDDLTIDDTAAPAGQAYVVSPTTVTRAGGPTVTYSGIESLGLLGSAGGGRYQIVGTGAGGTFVGGPGNYAVQGDRLTGSNTFFGGTGDDTFALNAGALVTGTVEFDGGGGSDSLSVTGTPADDGIALHLTASGVGYLIGLGKRVTFAGVEGLNLDAAAGTNSLAWIDDTRAAYGSAEDPTGGIVYTPTGPGGGQVVVAGAVVLPVVTFSHVTGTFTVNGDGDGSGYPDALTVLAPSTTGFGSPLGEATAADGSDTITVSDQLVTITNASLGKLTGVSLAQVDGAPTISAVLVRTGTEPDPAGDDVTAIPSNRVNILVAGSGAGRLAVGTTGLKSLVREDDPVLGTAAARVVQQRDGASVGFVGFRSVTGTNVKVAGTGTGVPAEVKVYDAATNALRFTLDPFPGFTGGLSVAAADVNGDGVPDVVVGAGDGGGPAVLVYDGVDGSLIASFFAYEDSFRGGVLVAAGDVNGDGHADIIAGTGVGGGPRVLVFSGKDFSVMANFFAYEESFRNGVLVAAGDVNGDGRADVICGTGLGGAPRVLAFDGVTFKVLHDFYAFDEGDRGGVSIGSGDVNGDGAADLIVGSGVGEAPQVRVFSGPDLTPLADFQVPWLSGGKSAGGGVHVAATDLDGDGVSDVLVGQAAGASPVVTGYKVVPSGTQPVELGQDTPFGTDDTGGIYVGGS